MPVSEVLRRLSQDPEFWTAGTANPAEPPELRVTLPIIGGYALIVDLDLTVGDRSLGLRTPAASEPTRLARVSHQAPFAAALCSYELDLFARVIALADPTLPHPGLVAALLSPFAPLTADDESAGVQLRAAAYRTLRRDVPKLLWLGPEQAPLPLFAGAHWWPQPPSVSPQVLDEPTIAALTAATPALQEVRSSARFPTEELRDSVRRAAAHLTQLPRDPVFASARPLAQRMVSSGDLREIPSLLAALTEAGCDHPTVLDALSEPLVPIEASWIVETLAGAEPGTLLRQQTCQGSPR